MHDEGALVVERSQTDAARVRLILEVDSVHVGLHIRIVLERLATLAAVTRGAALVLHADVLVEERLARKRGVATVALELLLGVHAYDVPSDLACHVVLVRAEATLEDAVGVDV